MVAQAIDHVALGHDADDPAVFDDRQRADPLFAERADRVGDARHRR